MQLGDEGGGFVKRAWHLPVECLVFAAVAERMVEDGYPRGAIDLQIEKRRGLGTEAKRPRLMENSSVGVPGEDSDGDWELARMGENARRRP